LDDTAEGNDWVDFPPQSFLSPNSQDAGQLSSTSDDFGRITSFTIITEDDANNINEDEDAAHARKCLFENIDVTWDGFITDDDEPTTSSLLTIETLQTEITQLTEELTQTKKRLESAKASNEALNEAHDKKHKELEQLNQDMDKFSDIIMLCMQQLRERNATLQSENEQLKLSNKDMSVRLNILTKCTEALNDAHDLKSEECEDLKRDMERFAETFAAQHNSLEELEGRLRKVMSSERGELQHSNEMEVKRSRRKSGRGHEMERIDELSDDEDNNETD
jgi:chromosome segregation ATPase